MSPGAIGPIATWKVKDSSGGIGIVGPRNDPSARNLVKAIGLPESPLAKSVGALVNLNCLATPFSKGAAGIHTPKYHRERRASLDHGLLTARTARSIACPSA